jgi:hypothetical protein
MTQRILFLKEIIDMNIQQYYQQTAYINLNGSIISAVLLSAILTVCMLLSWNIPLPVILIPFLTVCLLHYHRYLLFLKKSKDSKMSQRFYADKEFLKQNDLMITFAPSPAMKLLFFTPDGMLAGEMKEMKEKLWRWMLPYFIDQKIEKTFGLYDASGSLIACFVIERNLTKIFDGGDELVGFFYPKKQNGEAGTAILIGGRKLKLKKTPGVSSELYLLNSNSRVASRVQKGWMPLEWSNVFVETNTPVIKFDYGLPNQERLAVFAALTHHFQYYNH